ncbi:MAG: Holliday junction branch migration DNA helicase RuvB [Simkaniaceae bacterium]|nr:Holliday junction branch migration DNA helicase RuvB [Simkaniaceae bacterium]
MTHSPHTRSSLIGSSWSERNHGLERQLRPTRLEEFVGQPSLLEQLEVLVGAAKQREEPPGHVLLYGPPGLGKTTIAHIIAEDMGAGLVVSSGPAIEKPADLIDLTKKRDKKDVLFIDEIHRLNRQIEELLYPAMEDFVLDAKLDMMERIQLEPFTLIGATTKIGLISNPMRSRFAFTGRLEYYDCDALSGILTRSARILEVDIDRESLTEIANRSRGTPRIANNLLRWVRDYAQMRASGKLDRLSTRTALEMLDIDFRGLNETDKRLLTHIIDHHQGGPVGIDTLAVAIGEDRSSLEEVNEPFLIMQGLLRRTPRGREATEAAFEHFGRPYRKRGGGDSCT